MTVRPLASIESDFAKWSFTSSAGREDSGGRRLDEILVYGGDKTTLLKKWVLGYGYFESSGAGCSQNPDRCKRLKLKSVQELPLNGHASDKPPYTIDYLDEEDSSYELPPRLSYAQDHWGYSNGATSNQNLLPSGVFINRPYEGANRDAEPEKVKAGMLRRINYPTGGHTEFDFEANKVSLTEEGAQILTASSSYESRAAGVAAEKDTYGSTPVVDEIEFTLPHDAYVTVYVATGNTDPNLPEWNGSLSLTDSEGNSACEVDFFNAIPCAGNYDPSSLNHWLAAGTYTLRATAVVYGDFSEMSIHWEEHVRDETAVSASGLINVPVGGVRIMQIRDHDGEKETVHRYVYTKHNDPTESSGRLVSAPRYAYTHREYRTGGISNACGDTECSFYALTSSSRAPLGTVQGSHICYPEVTVLQGEGGEAGKTEYTYTYEPDTGGTGFPFTSETSMDWKRGLLRIQKDYEAGNSSPVHTLVNTYDFREEEAVNNTSVTSLKVAWRIGNNQCYQVPAYTCGAGDIDQVYYGNCDGFLGFTYVTFLPSTGGLFSNNCNIVAYHPCYGDSVGTVIPNPRFEQQFAYRTFETISRWYQLKKTVETTDGVVVTTDYGYDESGNHTNPLEIKLANSDGKVHTTKYSYPDNGYWSMTGDESAAVAVMKDRYMISVPLRVEKYVREAQGSGLGGQVAGVWNYYNLFAGISTQQVLPRKYIGFWGGWDPDDPDVEIPSYTTDGFPLSVIKRGWEPEVYTWQDGLLIQKDFVDWTWEWDWYFGTDRQLKTYTDIDGQSVEYQYDGFQRLKEVGQRDGEVVTSYAYEYGAPQAWQGGNYVRTQVEYPSLPGQNRDTYAYFDGLGRAKDTWRMGYGPGTEDIVSEHVIYDNHGRVEKSVYLPDIQAGLSYTTFSYDDSPLNRKVFEEYPDGNGIETRYLSEGQKYKVITIDENGHPNYSLTDIIGRQVEVRNAQTESTFFDYDDRDNLTKVTNPLGEHYLYFYDARNRMTTKIIPGQDDCQNFLYDERNLVTATRDPNLKHAGKWLGHQYDEYGRVLRTGFGSPVNGSGIYCTSQMNVDTEFNITQDLIVNTYDAQTTGASACGNGYTPIGKLSSTHAAVLNPDGTVGGLMLVAEHCYDQYGRVVHTQSASLSGEDVYATTYDMADNLLSNARDHAQGKISYTETFTVDHSGRMKTYSIDGSSQDYVDKVSYPFPISLESAGASYAYNTKDQLEAKTVGPAQLVHMYNSRGWLETINNMPFDQDPLIMDAACVTTAPPPPPPPGNGDIKCAACPEGQLTLAQLLKLRFSGELNVDCYQDCSCTAACTNDLITPCLDSTLVGGDGTPVEYDELDFPDRIYHILKCTDEKRWVVEKDLAYVSEDYSVMERIQLEDEGQTFKVEVDGSEMIVDVPGLVALIEADSMGTSDMTIKTGTDKMGCDGCTDEAPDCTGAQKKALEEALHYIAENLITSIDGLSFPTNLYRIRLCTGEEIYLFDEELAFLEEGSYFILQTIEIERPSQELAFGDNQSTSNGMTFHLTLMGYLCTRDLKGKTPINYYAPCKENICGEVGQAFAAKGVSGSQYFFEFPPNTPPHGDLTTLYPGAENSLVTDGVYWDIEFGASGFEAEWDIGLDLAPDADLHNYSVVVSIGEYWGAAAKIGLHDGQDFISVNGGLDHFDFSGNGIGNYQDITIVPDQMVTAEQAKNMKVVLSRNQKGVQIDGVAVVTDYTQPCDRCVQEKLECKPDNEKAQALALADI